MNDSVTMQDLRNLEAIRLNEIREINTHHREEVKDLRVEIAKLTTLLEQEKYKSAQLDKGWNKTIDTHEVTKNRLALYENEVGVPHYRAEAK